MDAPERVRRGLGPTGLCRSFFLPTDPDVHPPPPPRARLTRCIWIRLLLEVAPAVGSCLSLMKPPGLAPSVGLIKTSQSLSIPSGTCQLASR